MEDGTVGSGIAPSGASTGEREAADLRNGVMKRYAGNGVKNHVQITWVTARAQRHCQLVLFRATLLL